jgi:hypothetical protein
MDNEENNFQKALRRAVGEEPPPVPLGQVRPICDPETVLRWFATREPAVVEWDYNPFARDRMR